MLRADHLLCDYNEFLLHLLSPTIYPSVYFLHCRHNALPKHKCGHAFCFLNLLVCPLPAALILNHECSSESLWWIFFFFKSSTASFLLTEPPPLALPGSWCKCSWLGRRYQFLKATQNNDCDYVSSPISYHFPWADSEFHVLSSHNCVYLWFCFSLECTFIPCYLEFLKFCLNNPPQSNPPPSLIP